jgi:hypothetical protein
VSFSKKSPHLRLQLAKHRDQFPSSRLLVTRIWKCFDIAAVVVITHRNGRGGFRQFSWRFRSRFISSGEWVKCNCCPSGRRAFSVGTGWRNNNSPATGENAGKLTFNASPPRCVAPFPGSGNGDDLSGRAVAVQVVICVLATSRRSIGPRSGAL